MNAKSLNIYQRVNAVMAQVGYVQKETKKVNNQYTFVSHDAVIARLRPFLIENGIVLHPTIIEHQSTEIEIMAKGSKTMTNKTVMLIQVDLVSEDNPEDRMAVQGLGYGLDAQDKGPGKAYSYAYKYALLKAFALETGDDPERDNEGAPINKSLSNQNFNKPPTNKPPTTNPTASQEFAAMLKSHEGEISAALVAADHSGFDSQKSLMAEVGAFIQAAFNTKKVNNAVLKEFHENRKSFIERFVKFVQA